MALEFTADGLTVETYDAIYTRLADALIAIYGADINLDAESPDGQRVGIFAKEILDLQSFLADLYASLDPDLANGIRLESIIKLTGITKRPGLQSSWDLWVAVDRTLTLGTDYVVEDPQGQQWSPASSTSITLGTGNSYTFTISSGNATAGTTYTNNSQTFTVAQTVAAGTTLFATGTGAPLASGTLTKTGAGAGDATLTFSAFARSTLVTFKSVLFGAIEGPANTVITPVTIILGVTSIISPTAATIGIDEETDAALRTRRNSSLELAAVSTVGRLQAALGNMTDVTDVKIYENDTDTTDATLDMVPHSLWIIVEGGDVADIAEVIAKNKTAGVALKGDVTETYVETITLEDGSTTTFDHVMKFDRPTLIPVTVTVDATRTVTGQSVDIVAIEAAIAAVELNIGENLAASRLYAAGYDVGEVNFYLSNLLVTGGGEGPTAGILTSAPDERYTLTVGATITVTEIP